MRARSTAAAGEAVTSKTVVVQRKMRTMAAKSGGGGISVTLWLLTLTSARVPGRRLVNNEWAPKCGSPTTGRARRTQSAITAVAVSPCTRKFPLPHRHVVRTLTISIHSGRRRKCEAASGWQLDLRETKAKHAGSGTICRTMRRTTCVRPRSHSTRPTVVTGDGVRRDTTQWRLLELIISFGAALGRQLKQLLFVEDQIAAASARLGNIRRPR